YNANSKVLEIVAYLMEILDMEKGGEIGARLHKIYAYILQQVLQVDVGNSIEASKSAETHLRTLRQAWARLAQQGMAVTPSQQASDAPKGGSEAAPVKRSATA
ncbi:MAG: flagellar export chaperone FliS, partial [Alphaproteobacteria bacterium]